MNRYPHSGSLEDCRCDVRKETDRGRRGSDSAWSTCVSEGDRD